MTPEPNPSKSPAEARRMLTGAPTPVVRVATDAISKSVIAVIRDVSLIVEAVVRHLTFLQACLFFLSHFVRTFQPLQFF